MEITVPADDAAPVQEPRGRYQARLSDGSIVWKSCSAVDCVLMGKTYHELYGFTAEITDAKFWGPFEEVSSD